MATTRAVACCISTARCRGALRLGGGLLIVALALGPAGSAADDFHARMDGVIARMHRAMHVASSGDPDRDFARMMVPHQWGVPQPLDDGGTPTSRKLKHFPR